jgi:hypothetical protein
VFSGVFITDAVDGVGDQEAGYTTTVDIETILEAFLEMSPRSACSIDEASLWLKAKLLVLGLLS